MTVRLVKPGEAGQGVGYLEDGTMVVVEHGRQHVNEEVEFVITRALQTSAGRMSSAGWATSKVRRGAPGPTPESHSPTAQST